MSVESVSRLSFVKLAFVCLVALKAFLVSGSAADPDIEFRGIFDHGGNPLFSLRTYDGQGSGWLSVGDVFAGYEIIAYRSSERILVLRKDGAEFFLSLGASRVRRGDIDSELGTIHESNLRQVAQASLIFANDHGDHLPGGDEVESIHDVARLLALGAGLNHHSMWIIEGDAVTGNEENLERVLDPSREGLDPDFEAQDIVAIDFATNLRMDMPSYTPVAWTRGLREDGTWDERGAFGESGGMVVFLGGNVARMSDLREDGGRLVRPDGTRTSNILEALPPEARVVGSGPATLHGATGSPSDENP